MHILYKERVIFLYIVKLDEKQQYTRHRQSWQVILRPVRHVGATVTAIHSSSSSPPVLSTFSFSSLVSSLSLSFSIAYCLFDGWTLSLFVSFYLVSLESSG